MKSRYKVHLRLIEERRMFKDLVQKVCIATIKQGTLRAVVDIEQLEE